MGENREWGAAASAVTSTRQIGQKAEDRACQYLRRRGLRLVERNYRCKTGEIDLIMRDDKVLVFVEVRYRHRFSASVFVSPVESINWYKQQRLIRAAEFFLLNHHAFADWPCRFDVVSLTTSAANADQEMLWVKDAFQIG